MEVVRDAQTSEEFLHLEKGINRILNGASKSNGSENVSRLLKKITSRANSFDSSYMPESPFQSNPLLFSHDYAKSPMLLEGPEDSNQSAASTSRSGNAANNAEEKSMAKTGRSEDDDAAQAQSEEAEADPEKSSLPGDFDPKQSELFEPHRFAPKDLLGLLRNVEADIHACELILQEEVGFHVIFLPRMKKCLHFFSHGVNCISEMVAVKQGKLCFPLKAIVEVF